MILLVSEDNEASTSPTLNDAMQIACNDGTLHAFQFKNDRYYEYVDGTWEEVEPTDPEIWE